MINKIGAYGVNAKKNTKCSFSILLVILIYFYAYFDLEFKKFAHNYE